MFAKQFSTRSLEAESFRKKFGDVRLFRASRALKKYRGIRPELVNHLPACTTGRARYPMIIRYSNGFDFNFRTEFCDSRKDCRPLRAIRHSVRGILHITAGKNSS